MSKKRKYSSYDRIGKFSIEEVLPFVVLAKELKPLKELGIKRNSPEWKNIAEKTYAGVSVKMNSQRYKVFSMSGCVCKKCGLVGTFFGLEQQAYTDNKDRYHFNLYGIDKDGNEVMFTKDHILPKSKGGKNILNNLQTMCVVCNNKKGNSLEE